jgi:cobaltochelatase CobN
MTNERMSAYKNLPMAYSEAVLIPIGTDTLIHGVGTADGATVEAVNRYLYNGGSENRKNLVLWLESRFEDGPVAPEPVVLPADGIFSPENGETFYNLSEYLAWRIYHGLCSFDSYVGLICHRTAWENEELQIEKTLISALERRGIGVIPVFSDGPASGRQDSRHAQRLISDCFIENGKPFIDAFISRTIFSVGKGDGKGMYDMAAELFSQLNIPVFSPIVSYFSSENEWRKENNPLMTELPWAFMTPELQGMTEPVIIGVRDNDTGLPTPLPERIEHFAGRVAGWQNLKTKKNRDKKIVLMLHNAPCSGVEATIGVGHELNVFESAALLLSGMASEGYLVDPLPKDGDELKEWIMHRRAYSDFRWTSAADILDSGGALYTMPCSEYSEYYGMLPAENRRKLEEMYGEPPGEGMVVDGNLLVTGIDLGNVLVMVEPKRGCYGPKCTGEVCKILQDPMCPPPHQYLATFFYLRFLWKADCCVQIGSHGALEFLPGKSSGMSECCWPDIALGQLPNLYIYHTGIPGEALTAKRRSYAVTIGHLPSVAPTMRPELLTLLRTLTEYQEAKTLGRAQVELLYGVLKEQLRQLPGMQEYFDAQENEEAGCRRLKQLLLGTNSDSRAGKRHIFGAVPDENETVSYIREVWRSDLILSDELSGLPNDEPEHSEAVTAIIRDALSRKTDMLASGVLALDALEIAENLKKTNNEMNSLMAALSGGYVSPGIYGTPDNNGRLVIPTGRNIYALDVDKVPSREAYEIGKQMAVKLIGKYLEEEGRYPEQISMNMISLDISRSKGEQMSQMLFLLGISPVWETNGRVSGLKVIPHQELGRPRIDVVLRITGVLRDSWPSAVQLLDDAVMLAVSLDEPDDMNYVRKHTRQLVAELEKEGTDRIERRSTIRIFGDPPGTFGAGIDLALKASAWGDEKDLARYFVQASSHAYGRELSGDRAVSEFVYSVKQTDVTYDTTAARRYDMLSTGFSAEVHGGFRLLAKTLGGRNVRQYQGAVEQSGEHTVLALKDRLEQCLNETMYNPIWKQAMIDDGYTGGGEIMHRLQNVFSWQCLTESVGDEAVDKLAREYLLDDTMRGFLSRENRYALEEAARRFLELHERGKWDGDPECLMALQNVYLDIEGSLEDGITERSGEIQGGAIEVVDDSKVEAWKEKLRQVDAIFKK